MPGNPSLSLFFLSRETKFVVSGKSSAIIENPIELPKKSLNSLWWFSPQSNSKELNAGPLFLTI